MVQLLRISRDVISEIVEHCITGYPHEVCGLLISDGEIIVSGEPVANVTSSDPRRTYTINPFDLIRVDDNAAEAGLEVIGNYHSHPNHPPDPSETDRDSAVSNWIYAVISVTMDNTDIKFWKLIDGVFKEVEVEILGDP